MTTGTSHPYAPLADGTGISYAIYNVRCAWHEGFHLDVLERTYSHLQRTSFSLAFRPMFGSLPLFAGYQHATDTPDAPINPQATLIDGIGFVDDTYYLGEAVSNAGAAHVPPLAKLAYNPYPGQTIYMTSKIYDAETKEFQTHFHWAYRTIGHYPQWGVFADVWHTALVEYSMSSGQPAAYYNYIWMRDVGAVDIWQGIVQLDGSLAGIEYYAIL